MAVKWVITIPVLALCVVSVLYLGIPGLLVLVACAAVLSWLWTPHLGELFARPFASLYDGGSVPPELRPAYSTAQARQKRGEYLEAIAEIHNQLARFPTNFEGQMLLAQIQAEDLKDLPAAELTIHRFCSQRGHAARNVTFALFSLADWHLQFGHDRHAARRALEEVIDLLPDSEFASSAAQRIAHLPIAEMLLSPEERRKFKVTEGVQPLGLLRGHEPLRPPETDPARAASDYVKQLEQHPLDTEAREKLAVIYADHYGRLDLAAVQLEQLIADPHQPAKSVVHWLNLLADLQIRAGADFDDVQQTLQRIIDRDPHLAAAEVARKRVDLLKLELKANQKSQGVKLGSYEQNLGLKRGRGAWDP